MLVLAEFVVGIEAGAGSSAGLETNEIMQIKFFAMQTFSLWCPLQLYSYSRHPVYLVC